jgi:uncharacterized coiled-coil protein SlyX
LSTDQRISELNSVVLNHKSTIHDLNRLANQRSEDLAKSETQLKQLTKSHGKDVADFRMQLEAKDVRADTQGQIISELNGTVARNQSTINELQHKNSELRDRLGNGFIIRERLVRADGV